MLKKILFATAALILTVPLLITPFTLYPYVHGKTIAVLLLAHIGVIAFLYYRYRDAAPALRWSSSAIALVVFLAGILAISMFGVNFERSFWGSWPRLLGLYHWVIIALEGWILGTVLNRDDWHRLMRYAVYVGGVTSAIAVLQKFLPIFVWHGYRVGSTLDNPSYLAGYLIFIVFWGMYLLWKNWQWPVAVATLLSAISIILTRTRGAMLGLAVGLALTIAILLCSKENRKRGLKLLALFLAGIALIVLFDGGTIQRLASTGISDTTVLSRLIIWKIAWRGFLERPVLGWGFENFNAPFNMLYNPLLLKFSIGETFADKAHNLPLEMFTTTGLIGGLAYFGLMLTFLAGVWRLVQKKIWSLADAAVWSGLLVAYGISLAFLFDQLFTVALFIFSLFYLHRSALDDETTSHRKLRSTLVVIGALLIVASLWQGVIRPAVASVYDHLGVSIFTTDPARGDADLKTALSFAGPWYSDVVAERAGAINSAILEKTPPRGLTREMTEDTFGQLTAMHSRYPYDIRFPVFMGYLGNWLGAPDNHYFEITEQVLKDALALNPARQQVGDILVENYMVRGHYDEAIAVGAMMVAAMPTVPDAHYYLGNALLLGGQEAKGFAELSLAEHLGYPSAGIKPYELLISQAIDRKDWNKAIGWYERAIAIEPTNASLFAQIAALYSRIGNKEKAIQAVNEAVRLNPNLKAEAEQFLKTLH